MNKTLLLCLFALLVGLEFAQAQSCGRRYRERVFNSVQVYRDVIYSRDAPKLIAAGLGTETTLPYDLVMDIRTPPPTDTVTKRPAFIMAFGGGFVDIAFMGSTVLVGTMDNEDVQALADTLAHWGYVTACIEYRTGFDPLSTTSVMRAVWRGSQDISAGVRFLRKNKEWFGIDENKIFIGGSSAGAFSCLHSTFIDGNERIPESYEQFPIVMQDLGEMHSRPVEELTAFNPFVSNSVLGNDVDSIADGIAAYWGALGDTNWLSGNNRTPVVMFHGTEDLIVDAECARPFSSILLTAPVTCGSIVLDTAMRNRNIPHELHLAAGEGHEYWGAINGDWGIGGPNAYWADMIQTSADFFYRIMQPATPTINGASVANYNQTYTYSVNNPANDGGYCWEIENGTIVSSNANGSSIQVYWGNSGTLGRVKVSRIDRSEVASLQRVFNVNLTTNVAVYEQNALSSFQLYPNPNRGQFTVAFESDSRQDYQIQIANLLGQTVWQQQFSSSQDSQNQLINAEQLPSGIYQLSVRQGSKLHSQKIIIE